MKKKLKNHNLKRKKEGNDEIILPKTPKRICVDEDDCENRVENVDEEKRNENVIQKEMDKENNRNNKEIEKKNNNEDGKEELKQLKKDMIELCEKTFGEIINLSIKYEKLKKKFENEPS